MWHSWDIYRRMHVHWYSCMCPHCKANTCFHRLQKCSQHCSCKLQVQNYLMENLSWLGMLHTAYQCCIYPQHTLYKLQSRFVPQILDCMCMLQWSRCLRMSPSVSGSRCNLIRHHCLLLPSTCQQHTQDTCHSTLQKCWQNACQLRILCKQYFLAQSYTCPRHTWHMVLRQGPRTLGYTCTPPKMSFLTMRSSRQDSPGTC